jgi:hypothetical protein
VREDNEGKVMTLGTLFDTDGRVAAISTQETQSQELKNNMKINLIAAKSYGWSATKVDNSQWAVNLLSAASDATFQANRALFGQQGDEYFAYISDRDANYRIKIFQQIGPVALGDFKNKKAEYGAGLDPAGLTTWAHLSQGTARDIWTLNEKRFSVLRARGVTSADLEALHGRARRTLEQAKSENSASLREAALASSAMLSHKVYLPLRASMDDLVNAVILLLLLSIPFGFAMERLIICATSVYGRITGFTVMSLVTFALLYAMHPGFAIASTPMIILMAFAITMLSAMVIYILLRKFKTELRAIQGQSATVHDLEVSRMGTMLAAVEMGVSTMRRRPTRTTLTAITVVILTFTILAFASFSRTVGVRAAYEGPLGESMHAGILVRRLDYSQVSPGVLDAVKGQEGKGGFIAMHYWLPRKKDQGWRSTVARPSDGESLLTDALMGIPVEELSRWPELAAALGKGTPEEKQQRMREGGVFLPPIVQEVLRLQVGSPVLVNGKKVVFAGTFDPGAMQRLKALDGQSILPVDFQDPALMAKSQQSGLQGETRLLIAKQSDRHFVHLSSHQVILASSELVRELGGQIHLITIYPGEGVNVAQRGRQLAEILLLPVWAAGPDGIERLILTILTEVSGGLALLVPLLLGGLIIFGTLLGSISDREKEIYTFSALGLSPGHVGVLFFAEAAVYAVVGGMGGQLLAQGAAYGATSLARAGYIEPTSVNYSSTNSLFAIGVVMLTVLVSAIYPAYRASKSANPGLARAWKMPAAEGDLLKMTFPFTVSAYDITGVVSFLAEHFRRHDDAGLGGFAASNVEVRQTKDRNLELTSDLALAPFDLGVTEHLTLTAVPSQIEGVDEVAVKITRSSGAHGDWYRSTRVFMRDLRRQFLLWRTLSNEMIEHYRLQTLQVLGVLDSEAAGRTPTPKQN